MDFPTFKNIIENVNSDIYLMIYIFLLENKPFTEENIKPYENKKLGNRNSSKQVTFQETNLIMFPSKNSNFSPYKVFLRNKARRTTVVNRKVDFSKMLKSNDPNSKKGLFTKLDKKDAAPLDFKRKGHKRRTAQNKPNLFDLKNIENEDEKKK